MRKNHLGEMLKQLRKEKHVTQQQISDQIYISKRALISYEACAREPNITTLIMLSDYFDVSLDYLITGEEYFDQIK